MTIPKISLTFDLEDLCNAYEPSGRWVEMTRRLLDFCQKEQRLATFFAVGRAALAAPSLIADIAAKGHEIAYHTHDHTPLDRQDRAAFTAASKADKQRLEQLTGSAVTGFRAPCFSLTASTLWATEALYDLGFRYSASAMPTRLSRYGIAAAPCAPFRWPSGLIELPMPTACFGPLRVPYGGGVYLYALPTALQRKWIERTNEKACLWTYAHPYDFDTQEPFFVPPNTPPWIAYLLWRMRAKAQRKLEQILLYPKAEPLGRRLHGLQLHDIAATRYSIAGKSYRKKG